MDESQMHMLSGRSQTKKATFCMISLLWHFRKGKTVETEIHQWLLVGKGMHRNLGLGGVEWCYIHLWWKMHNLMHLSNLKNCTLKGWVLLCVMSILTIIIVIIIVVVTEAEWVPEQKSHPGAEVIAFPEQLLLTFLLHCFYPHYLPCLQLLLFTVAFHIFTWGPSDLPWLIPALGL